VKFFSFLIFVIEADDLPDLTAGLSSLSNATSPIKFFTKIGRVVLTRRVLADRQTKDLLGELGGVNNDAAQLARPILFASLPRDNVGVRV